MAITSAGTVNASSARPGFPCTGTRTSCRNFASGTAWTRVPTTTRCAPSPAIASRSATSTSGRSLLPHAPGIPNVGFVIRAGHGTNGRTIVVATDFHDFPALLPHLPGADFVFVEANHDLELLRRHSNPNSRWHLSNVKTASLLCRATLEGGFAPRAVVLGHLSDERNREVLAVGEVRRAFDAHGLKMPFALEAAPKFEPSRTFKID